MCGPGQAQPQAPQEWTLVSRHTKHYTQGPRGQSVFLSERCGFELGSETPHYGTPQAPLPLDLMHRRSHSLAKRIRTSSTPPLRAPASSADRALSENESADAHDCCVKKNAPAPTARTAAPIIAGLTSGMAPDLEAGGGSAHRKEMAAPVRGRIAYSNSGEGAASRRGLQAASRVGARHTPPQRSSSRGTDFGSVLGTVPPPSRCPASYQEVTATT